MPIPKTRQELVDYVQNEVRDGTPLKDDPIVRQRIARLATELEVARVLGLRFVAQSMKGGAPPTCESSQSIRPVRPRPFAAAGSF